MDTDELRALWRDTPGRWLVAGPPGSGKSTLIGALVGARPTRVVVADPGQPLFGPPGAVSLGSRGANGWAVVRVEGIASLDAGRFRLPLLRAALRLGTSGGPILVDAPGVARGTVASELLAGLVDVLEVGVVVWIGEGPCPVAGDVHALGAALYELAPHPEARTHSRGDRAALRTASWDGYLRGAVTATLHGLAVTGAPPPVGAWGGRQAAVLDEAGRTLVMGEIVAAGSGRVELRAPAFDQGRARGLVIRDAVRDAEGRLRTAARAAPPQPAPDLRAPVVLPTPAGVVTDLCATLVGGVLGDPMVRLDAAEAARVLLIDLGEHPELHVRVAHRVTHALVSHAHMDHFNGFPWLLRRRVGLAEPLTLFGPPDLSRRVAGFVDGITWDRIGETGPRFRVGEVHDGELRWFDVRAGDGRRSSGAAPIVDGVVHREADFTVRAAVLDHGIPVVAWSVEEPTRWSVRADALAARGLAPGPWLGELKRRLTAGERDAPVTAPDGVARPAGELARGLVIERRGRKLVYATDFGDTRDNRDRLVALARGADIFVCEASFLVEDVDRAERTGHLTTRACGEIAAEAGVALLVPFHFSTRYADRIEQVYAEISAAFPRVWPQARSRSGS